MKKRIGLSTDRIQVRPRASRGIISIVYYSSVHVDMTPIRDGLVDWIRPELLVPGWFCDLSYVTEVSEREYLRYCLRVLFAMLIGMKKRSIVTLLISCISCIYKSRVDTRRLVLFREGMFSFTGYRF